MTSAHIMLLAVSLFSVHAAHPMLLFKDKIPNKNSKILKFSYNNFFKRNIVLTTSCLIDSKHNNKVLLLGDMHEAPGVSDNQMTSMTPFHTQQMLTIVNGLIKNKKSTLFLEASPCTKRLIALLKQQRGNHHTNLMINVIDHMEKKSMPYVNFDTRDTIDTLMSGLVELRLLYTDMLLQGRPLQQETSQALLTPVSTYISKIKEKKTKTVLTLDGIDIPQEQKTNLIKKSYELADGITEKMEEAVACNNLPENTPLLYMINILGELYPQFPLYNLTKESSFHIDINLLAKLLQKKSHLSIALGGFFHITQVEEQLKLAGYTVVDEQKNGLVVDIEKNSFGTYKTPKIFLTDAVNNFIE